jgi:cytochrome c-type biogenesis protein CcmE
MKRNESYKDVKSEVNWKTLGAGAALLGTTLAVLPATTLLLDTKPAQAQNYYSPIRVALNGQYINFGNVPPQSVGGRVLVPLRGVFESLGATVNYDAATRMIYANSGGREIQLRLGSSQAVVNGQTQYLDVPAQSRLGRTLVPLRFVSEALGATVQWNGPQQTVYITSGSTNPGPGPIIQPPIGQPPIDETYYPPNNFPGTNQTTVTGIVERDLVANNEFDIITDNGTLLRVRTNVNEPATLSRGDRVQVTGRTRDGYFQATTVRILNQSENTTGQRVRLTGSVVQVFSSTRFSIRTDAGAIVSVTSTTNIPENLSPGDRVRVVGNQSGNYLSANRVVLVSNANTDTTPIGGQSVRFNGIITSVDEFANTLQVQADNGQYYIVRYVNADDFREGDRVRVSGNYSNGVTTATTVTRTN